MKHLGVEIYFGDHMTPDDETEFDCDACTRVHFREDGDDYEDNWGKPYRICKRCASHDIPQYWRLTLKGATQEGNQ
jgi:hypothetical protein